MRGKRPTSKPDRAVGSSYIHRQSGQLLRVLRASARGYLVALEGLGQLVLSKKALQQGYRRIVAARARLPRFLSKRSRRVGTAVLTLASGHRGHELSIVCEDSHRSARMRFIDPDEALFWFERITGIEAFLRIARTLSGNSI
jgi:hypothetical protein